MKEGMNGSDISLGIKELLFEESHRHPGEQSLLQGSLWHSISPHIYSVQLWPLSFLGTQ